MSYDINGQVKKVMDLQTFDSGFTKREFVITTADQYPQDVKFETVRDKTALVDVLNEGDQVTVSFDVRGNAFKDKFYVNLNCWKIATEAKSVSAPSQTEAPAQDDTDSPF